MAQTRAARLPTIPDVSSVPDVPVPLRAFLAAVATTLNLLLGRLKNADQDDRLVTFRDLGSDRVKGIASGWGLGGTTTVIQGGSGSGAEGVVPADVAMDYTAPPALASVVVTTTLNSLMVSYTQPIYTKADSLVSNHAHTMLYLADANPDGSSPGFGAARASAQAAGPVIYASIGPGRKVYCWLRNISKADVPGAIYGGASGVFAETPPDLSMIDRLLGMDPSSPFKELNTPTTVGGFTYPAGVYIDAAYINNVNAIAARFGTAAIDSAVIGDLTAFKARFTNLEAYSANLGNVKIASDGSLSSVGVDGMNTGRGVFLGWDGLAYSFRVGSPAGEGPGFCYDGRTNSINWTLPNGDTLIATTPDGNVILDPAIDNRYAGVKVVDNAAAITAPPGSDAPGGEAYWAVYDKKTSTMAAWSKELGCYTFAPKEGEVATQIDAAIDAAFGGDEMTQQIIEVAQSAWTGGANLMPDSALSDSDISRWVLAAGLAEIEIDLLEVVLALLGTGQKALVTGNSNNTLIRTDTGAILIVSTT